MPAALNPRRFYERLLDQRARSDPRGNEVLMRGLEKKELMLVNKNKFIKGEVLVLGHTAWQLQLIADVLYISK